MVNLMSGEGIMFGITCPLVVFIVEDAIGRSRARDEEEEEEAPAETGKVKRRPLALTSAIARMATCPMEQRRFQIRETCLALFSDCHDLGFHLPREERICLDGLR